MLEKLGVSPCVVFNPILDGLVDVLQGATTFYLEIDFRVRILSQLCHILGNPSGVIFFVALSQQHRGITCYQELPTKFCTSVIILIRLKTRYCREFSQVFVELYPLEVWVRFISPIGLLTLFSNGLYEVASFLERMTGVVSEPRLQYIILG